MTTTSVVTDRGLTLAELRVFGPLAALLDIGGLRDVLVQCRSGYGTVWIDCGRGLERVENLAPTTSQVQSVAVSLIAAGGRHIDELHPCADVRLGDGIRVHAVLAPIVREGAALSIRFPSTARPTFQQLVAGGLCQAATAKALKSAVSNKLNLLITGATGSGKTTLLAALLGESHQDERIISIEEVQELHLRHPHHLALESRQANTEGTGEVSIDRLLRESLRMRPDRIVVGECRGAEIVTLLTALNTGHEGGAGTLHANSISDVPARLETLGMMGGLSPEALARQAASALHLIVHVAQDNHTHRVESLAKVAISSQGLLSIAPANTA